MKSAISSRQATLETYINHVCQRGVDELTQSHLIKFGAVLVCGYIERSVEVIILERLDRRAQPRVIQFVKSHFKKGTNYDCSAIESLLQRFDEGWYNNFHSFVEKNPDIKEIISSCYSVRNSIAHGGSANIGQQRLRELFSAGKTLVDALVESTNDGKRGRTKKRR